MVNRTKLLTIVGLGLFCVLVFLPPIIHGYVYPSVGDDTAAHLQVFDKIQSDTYGDFPLILSYRLVGYPIVWLSNWTSWSIDIIFLWFNYASLVTIGLTIYFIISRLVNRTAGWLALAVTLFGAQGIFFQFYYGQIFNAINLGIILPWVLYFTVRYLTQGRWYQIIGALVLGGLFGAFHTSGIYLPFVAGFALCTYIVYSLVKRQSINLKAVYLGGSVAVLSLIVFLMSITNAGDLWEAVLHQLSAVMAVPLSNYFMGIVSPTVLILVVFTIVFMSDILKRLSSEAKVIIFLLFSITVVLGVSAFARLSLDPFRQALDFATVLAMLVAVMVGGFIWKLKSQFPIIILVLAVSFGLWHNVPTWLDYNSAIRPADKEAISYVEELGFYQYNTSPEIAHWIYDRVTVSAEYSDNVSGVLIVRNLPMTPRSDLDNKWYEIHGIDPDNYKPIYGDDSFEDDYGLMKTFDDGKVIVKVYENLGNAYLSPIGGK